MAMIYHLGSYGLRSCSFCMVCFSEKQKEYHINLGWNEGLNDERVDDNECKHTAFVINIKMTPEDFQIT